MHLIQASGGELFAFGGRSLYIGFFFGFVIGLFDWSTPTGWVNNKVTNSTKFLYNIDIGFGFVLSIYIYIIVLSVVFATFLLLLFLSIIIATSGAALGEFSNTPKPLLRSIVAFGIIFPLGEYGGKFIARGITLADTDSFGEDDISAWYLLFIIGCLFLLAVMLNLILEYRALPHGLIILIVPIMWTFGIGAVVGERYEDLEKNKKEKFDYRYTRAHSEIDEDTRD